MNARRFLFGDDFRAPPASAAIDAAVLADAEADAFARGLEAGRREEAAASGGALLAASDRIEHGLAVALAAIDDRLRPVEDDAAAFFVALARKLAGQALAAYPLAAIADAAHEAFAHLRGVPHLAVRVHPDLVDPVDSMLARTARERGYEGRVIVLGDEDTLPGDARVEWADGGIVRDRAALDAAAGAILARHLPAPDTSSDGTP